MKEIRGVKMKEISDKINDLDSRWIGIQTDDLIDKTKVPDHQESTVR
jgi:hypothetical protein